MPGPFEYYRDVVVELLAEQLKLGPQRLKELLVEVNLLRCGGNLAVNVDVETAT